MSLFDGCVLTEDNFRDIIAYVDTATLISLSFTHRKLVALIPEGRLVRARALDLISCCAEHDYLALAHWARESGCSWSSYAPAIAAEGGHVEMLRWLYDSGCPWDERTCAYTEKSGNLSILMWLRERKLSVG